MEVLIRNAEGNLSQNNREYAAKKLDRLARYFGAANKVELVHREVKKRHQVEVTIFADGHTVRGEASDTHIESAIDKLADRLERRLVNLKRRVVGKRLARQKRVIEVPIADWEWSEKPLISEHKRVALKPVSLEEAILQMELLDHPFFLFHNRQTKQNELIYRMRDGSYGHMQPLR